VFPCCIFIVTILCFSTDVSCAQFSADSQQAQKENPSVTCNDLGLANPCLGRIDEMTVSECVRGVKVGSQFGSRTAIGCPFSVGENSIGRTLWMVVAKCECGKIEAVHLNCFKAGRANMCRSCQNQKTATIHGDSDTKEAARNLLYGVWAGMRNRCRNINGDHYHRYGGRGIYVCSEWEDYQVFREWAQSSGYQPGLSIDRIDNDGNYEPSNCQWLTVSENSRKAWVDRRAKATST
jgi:hypothetical protein